MTFVIEFRFPETDQPVYAGMAGDTFGWAWTPDTALVFDSEEEAGRVLANAYGPSTEHGYIVENE